MTKNKNNAVRAMRVFSVGLLLMQVGVARSGELGITYVKTLGQIWPETPLLSSGGRLAVDEKNNLYAGTPGQNSFLHKISPDGRVIWRADDTHNAYLGTAVDDKYVYGCGIGYYGYRHLLRRKKESGVIAPGWKFVWPKSTDVVQGVKGFEYPGALLVDETHLYVLDIVNGELRRLDKNSGAEKPFANNVKIEGASDMAFSKNGAILILANPKIDPPPAPDAPTPTSSFVAEIETESGKTLREQMITGLTQSAAIAVHPKSGEIFIGEGGSALRPINKVRVFSADGKDTNKTIGRGGEWQGAWSSNAFAFSGAGADICFDNDGGWWTNVYGGRTRTLGVLQHFSPANAPDKTFLSAAGEGVAPDESGNVAVGGNYKLSWDGDVMWTSGLLSTGKPGQFPTTIDYWIVKPVYSDAAQSIFVNVHGPWLFALDAKTGEHTGKGIALPVPAVSGATSVGRNIYILGGGKIHRTNADLEPLQEHFVLPEEVVKKGPNSLAVGEDGNTLFVSAGNGADARLYAFKDGAQIWEAKAGAVLTRYKNVLLALNPAGAGVLVLSAEDGALASIVGNVAIDNRPALTNVSGAAVGRKDGADYLFITAAARVLVYRIAAAD